MLSSPARHGVMPIVTLELTNIEERVRLIRRRLNAHTVQHALYLAGSLGVVVVTLVIAVALPARSSMVSLIVWSSLGSLGAAAVLGTRIAKTRWFSLSDAARLVDHHAQLDDRLTTLLADRVKPHPSPLRALLIHQVLSTTAQWEPKAVAPHAVPRSIYLFVLALLALAGTNNFKQQDAPSPPPPAPHATDGPGAINDEHLATSNGMEPAPGRSRPAPHSQLPKSGRGKQSLRTSPSNQTQAGQNADGADNTARATADRATQRPPGQPRANDPPAARNAGDPQAPQGRNRQSLSAQPAGSEMKNAPDAAPRPAEAPNATLPSADTAKNTTGTGNRSSKDQSKTAQVPTTDQSGPRASGGLGGMGPGGLLAGTATGSAPAARPKTFTLKLADSSSSVVREHDRDGPQGERGSAPGFGSNTPTENPSLTAQASEDAPQYRADLSPEHQLLVRRIFGARE